MHYFANGGDARNIRVAMDYLHNKVISKGENNIHFKAWADNAGEIFDSINLKSNQEVLLKLVGDSWQKNQCQSTSCQSPLLNSQTGFNGMRSEGIVIGDIPKDNYGNIILKFNVIEIPKAKIIDNKESKLVTTIPIGASLSSPKNIPILQVLKNNEKNYTLSKNISAGDIIWFEIHSFGNKAPLQNVVNKLGNIDNKIFNADSSAKVVALASATGVTPINGSVILHFNDKVKMKFAGYKWFVKKMTGVQSKESDNRKILPNNQNGASVLKNGVNLGSLPENYRSNFLVRFKVVKAE